MKKYFLSSLFVLISLSLYECTSDSQAGNKVKLPKALPPLVVDSIYNSDLVINYIFDNEERDTDSARQASKQLFLLAIDFYKNKKNRQDAIPLFKKSLALFPDAKTYNELGNALFENNDYKECLRAYKMAVNLKYSPLSDTYFNMACAEAELGQSGWEAANYLSNSFENGFSDSTRYISDPHLNSIRNERYYADYLSSHFGKQVKRENAKFNIFLKEFEPLEIPFTITAEKAGDYNDNKFISYDYSDYVDEMENVSFGRDVSNEFSHVGVLKKTNHYTAVLYSSVEMMGGPLSPVYTMIVTYNPKGDLISKKVFSCLCSGEKVKTGSFDGELITLEEKKVIWEKPFDSVSPEENKISSYETVETTKYVIDESGTINPVTGS